MKVSQKLARCISTLLIIGAIGFCLPVVGFAQQWQIAPINPQFEEYQNNINTTAAAEVNQSDEHTYGRIPSIIDFSYLKGRRILNGVSGSLPSTYDLRDYNKLTSVKNQGNCGSCWAHAAMGALESYLMPEENWDFSENNLKNLSGFDYGCCSGGTGLMSSAYFLRWNGPVKESDDPYSYSCSSSTYSPQKHVQNILVIPARDGYLDNDSLKRAVMSYGAVDVSYIHRDYFYNSSTCSYYAYYTSSDDGNCGHEICLVGWDDNYSKTNFLHEPPGNGAFIMKNSWGPSWGRDGYFYISYYDINFANQESFVYKAEAADNYDTIYQYDPLGWVSNLGYSSETAWFANVFTASDNNSLAAVGWYTSEPNSPYEVYIYKDPTNGPLSAGGFVAKKTGIIADPGYTTIRLDSTVSLTAGQKFSVVVKLNTPGYNYPVPIEYANEGYSSAATANSGESYVSTDGSSWTDLWANFSEYKVNSCLKAYSTEESKIPPKISVTSPTTDSIYYTNQSVIDVCGTASDDKSISSVEWENTTLSSGKQLCEDGGGWTTWCARNIALGSQNYDNLLFTATDSDGKESTATLTVIQDLNSPTVTITSPTAEDYYRWVPSINILGTASDDNSIASVTWSNSGTGASGTCSCTGLGTTSATWSASGITAAGGDAENVITVTATDKAGNTSTDTLTLVNDNINPTINITGPTSESTYFPETSSISISGTASDNYAVAQVSWRNSGTSASGICSRTKTGNGSVSWSASGVALADGEDANVITVTATDTSGNTSTDTLTVTHYQPLKEIQIYPSNVGLVQGMSQKFTVIPVDINGNVRPLPGGTGTSWTATTGEINAQTGDFTAGLDSSIITLTAGSTVVSANVEVFPKSVAGGYALERWWGGNMDKPVGVAFGSNGSVYLVDSVNNRIQKYSSIGCYDPSFSGIGHNSFNTPRDIAVDSSGNFYVSDTRNNRIQKYDSNWQYVTQWGASGAGYGQFASPNGIAVDEDDNVYVADSGNNRIQKFDSSGNYIAQLTSDVTTDGAFWWPRDVAVAYDDGSKYVYVLDTLNDRVVKFSESSANSFTAMLSSLGKSVQPTVFAKVAAWGAPGTGDGEFINPSGISIDLSGDVLVTDSLNNRVQIFDSAGNYVNKFGGSGTGGFQFMQPTGIANDTDGSVYVVDTDNDRVQKYVPSEETSVTIDPPTDDFDGYWHDSQISLSGSCTGLIVSVLWANSTTGENGVCTGTRNWTLADMPLALGKNSITITALDTSGGQAQDTLVVYYTLGNHILTVSTPSFNPSVVASGATTTVNATVEDSLKHTVTYNWSDGNAGGTFADPHAASTTYTAPINTDTDDIAVTITCQATCQVDSSIVASASSQLIVTGKHEISVTSVNLTPSTVDPFDQVACSITAEDSRGDDMLYQWSDSGAGGTFYPSANVQAPTYTAPDNSTESDKHITISCTAVCSVVSSVKAVKSATLVVTNPAPTISITSPTSDAQINRTGATINLAGTASSDTTSIVWSNASTGDSGTISGATNWQISSIPLSVGSNLITVTAYDDGKNSAVQGIDVTRIATPVASAWQGLCMAALPIIPDDTDPGNVVNFFDVDWMTYKTKRGVYFGYGNDPYHYCWFEPTSATPGRGFWAVFKSTPEDPCGTVPDQTKSTTDKPNLVSIHLYKGWNLVGQPFMKTVAWDTSTITLTTPSGVSIDASNFSKYVSTYAWGWRQDDSNPYTGEYYLIGDPDVISGATGEMAPWRAYWLRALQECYLIVPAP